MACEMKESEFQLLQELPGNRECIDCGSKKPDWGSPNLGILFCFQCSGIHRGLGTHISFVRSVRMDHWTDKQVQLMKQGGNEQCKQFLQSHGIDVTVPNFAQLPSVDHIRAKYDNEIARWYKLVLLARVEGNPEPTTLPPEVAEPLVRPPPQIRRKMEGFGSAPPPPENNFPSKQMLWAVPVGAVAAGVALIIFSQHAW